MFRNGRGQAKFRLVRPQSLRREGGANGYHRRGWMVKARNAPIARGRERLGKPVRGGLMGGIGEVGFGS